MSLRARHHCNISYFVKKKEKKRRNASPEMHQTKTANTALGIIYMLTLLN